MFYTCINCSDLSILEVMLEALYLSVDPYMRYSLDNMFRKDVKMRTMSIFVIFVNFCQCRWMRVRVGHPGGHKQSFLRDRFILNHCVSE